MRGSTLLCFVTLALIAVAADKPLDCKTGKLIDVRTERGSRLVGTLNQTGGELAQRRNDATYYQIDAGEIIFTAKRTLTRRGDKQLDVTVNAPVKFAIQKDELYLMDEQGKSHKLAIEKKDAQEDGRF